MNSGELNEKKWTECRHFFFMISRDTTRRRNSCRLLLVILLEEELLDRRYSNHVVNDTTRWSCLEQHQSECMVNNTILYSEFVFSSSNIKIEFVTVHFKTWLHDWFLELGLLSKNIGSYVTLKSHANGFSTNFYSFLHLLIFTRDYGMYFKNRNKKYTYKSCVE